MEFEKDVSNMQEQKFPREKKVGLIPEVCSMDTTKKWHMQNKGNLMEFEKDVFNMQEQKFPPQKKSWLNSWSS